MEVYYGSIRAICELGPSDMAPTACTGTSILRQTGMQADLIEGIYLLGLFLSGTDTPEASLHASCRTYRHLLTQRQQGMQAQATSLSTRITPGMLVADAHSASATCMVKQENPLLQALVAWHQRHTQQTWSQGVCSTGCSQRMTEVISNSSALKQQCPVIVIYKQLRRQNRW